jgi:predicted aspartyl protease
VSVFFSIFKIRTLYRGSVVGEVTETITLMNSRDIGVLRSRYIKETGIRQLTVNAVVDTGAMSLVIGEKTCNRLGLPLKKKAPRLS